MNRSKFTKKQKKLFGSVLAAIVVVVLALAGGKDIGQIFSKLIESEAGTSEIQPTISPESGTAAPVTDAAPNSEDAVTDTVREDGIYTTPEQVAAYIHTFHRLPSNFITKGDAAKLGWDSSKGNLWDVTDEMSIGGDTFGNYEKLLPDEEGRTWYECDVNYTGGFRGGERIVYSNDGLIYYTDDHYESFTMLYDAEGKR